VVWHLLFQNGRQANLSHARTAQYSLSLNQGGGGNHKDIITAALPAGFKQQWYVEHDERLAPSARVSKKSLLLGGDHRVKDAFEPIERRRVGKNALAEKPSIDTPSLRFGPWESIGDGPDSGAARREKPVNHSIGIEERHPKAAEHRGGRALSHTDRARKAEDDQCDGTRLATIAARNSGVTFTGVPNQASKPGRP
jgi:hypothetical protein